MIAIFKKEMYLDFNIHSMAQLTLNKISTEIYVKKSTGIILVPHNLSYLLSPGTGLCSKIRNLWYLGTNGSEVGY